jgi:hypothetical protein
VSTVREIFKKKEVKWGKGKVFIRSCGGWRVARERACINTLRNLAKSLE